MRSTAAVKRCRATLGSLTPPVARLRRMPRMPALPHRVEIALRRLVVDHGDAARVGAARRHAEERGGVVGAVDARRDDDHALHVQRLVQRRHFLRRGQFRRVDAAGKEREFLGIAVDMGVAVAGAGRHVEIHRRRRLRRFGGGGLCCSWSLRPRWRQASYCVASASVFSLHVVVDCRCLDGRGARLLRYPLSRALFRTVCAGAYREKWAAGRALVSGCTPYRFGNASPVYRTGGRYRFD